MSDRRAQRILIDRPVQTALLVRAASYWLFCMVTIGVLLMVWGAWSGPPDRSVNVVREVSERYAPALLASLFLLPLVLLDVLRLSHRFVGPVARVRQGLGELAAGKRPAPLKFRDDDFWPEMAAEFNAAAEHIDETREVLVATRMSNTLS